MTELNFPLWKTKNQDTLLEADLSRAFNYLKLLLPGDQIKITTSDTAISSADVSDTLTDDPFLIDYTITANTWYQMDGVFLVHPNSSVMGIKYLFNCSATPAEDFFSSLSVSSAGVIDGDSHLAFIQEENLLIGSIQDYSIRVTGILKGHATSNGTLDFQWAQNTSSASTLTMLTGSWLRLKELNI